MARGLASSPNLVLIDETITSLDKFSQIHFLEKLDQLCAGKTLIMASNDLRFLPGFDWVLVMENGRIVDQGTHEELLGRSSTYKKLYESERSLSIF